MIKVKGKGKISKWLRKRLEDFYSFYLFCEVQRREVSLEEFFL